MDPNETLRLMREARKRYVYATTEAEAINAATDLAATSADLDKWLTSGEFPPDEWSRSDTLDIPFET